MSEYTTIYLRKKGEPLLKYRSIVSEKTLGLTKEEYISLQEEIRAYNKTVDEGLGCELFYIETTPSRQLEVLPYSEDPSLLTIDMLAEILDFYAEEIEEEKQFIRRCEEKMRVLEDRIRAADVKLYNKIDQEIFENKACIDECQETLKKLQFLSSRFEFVANIMRNSDNAERYELLYTKA